MSAEKAPSGPVCQGRVAGAPGQHVSLSSSVVLAERSLAREGHVRAVWHAAFLVLTPRPGGCLASALKPVVTTNPHVSILKAYVHC